VVGASWWVGCVLGELVALLVCVKKSFRRDMLWAGMPSCGRGLMRCESRCVLVGSMVGRAICVSNRTGVGDNDFGSFILGEVCGWLGWLVGCLPSCRGWVVNRAGVGNGGWMGVRSASDCDCRKVVRCSGWSERGVGVWVGLVGCRCRDVAELAGRAVTLSAGSRAGHREF